MRRRWTNLPLRAKVLVVLAVPLVPLLTSAVLVILSARQEREAQQWVAHTLEVKAQIEATLVLTVEANASVEAYLLTHRREALQPFMTLGQQWPATMQRLVDLVRDNPEQVDRLKAIAALQGRNPLVTLVQYGVAHPDEAIPEAMLAENEKSIDTFRADLADMHAVEDRLLVARVAASDRAQRVLEITTLAGASFGLLGSVVAAMAFAGGITQRVERARQNAERLAHGSELLPCPEVRYDEVGALARSLHDASALLKAREAELRARVAEVGVINQELEAFTYSVSHDLRAPLRHITGFTALLVGSAESRLTTEDRGRLNTITEAASRMGRLIDDLLSFSRMGRTAIAKRRIRLDDVVRDARKEVAVNGANGVERQVSWTVHSLPEVEADPAMLRLVFVNLLDNAIKYTRNQLHAAVEVGVNGHAPGEIGETVVFVRDNGVGFDMQYAGKLFGVFQRLHNADEFEGTGIGLANVRRIIHRHGGRTWAEGAVNEGATFYFSLPHVEAGA